MERSPGGGNELRSGIVAIFLTYTVWGLQPLYWRALSGVPLLQILAHRILWSLPILLGFVALTGRWKALGSALRDGRSLARIGLCACLIGSNWLLNIWAPLSGQVVEASLGQYTTPIVVVAIGIVVLRERPGPQAMVALVLACVGVAVFALGLGRLPLIAVLLVLTFALYTFLKKTSCVDSVAGVTAEMLALSPFAFVYLVVMEFAGTGAAGKADPGGWLLLGSTGLFTAAPLALFSYGVRRIDLSKLGFIQYYAPSLNLLIGVFAFGEPFSRAHLRGFPFIWAAVLAMLAGGPVSARLGRRSAARGGGPADDGRRSENR